MLDAHAIGPELRTTAHKTIRAYIVENFLLGKDDGFANSESLYESGILDSTSIMELVGFLENNYDVTVEDEDLTEENLGSIDAIVGFVQRKTAAAARPAQAAEEG